VPNAQQPRGGTDLLPGAISAFILLILALPLHLPFLLSLGAAGLVYLGLFWLRREPASAPTAAPTPSLAQMRAEIESLSRQIACPEIRQRVSAIGAQAEQIGRYLAGHPESAGQWNDYVEECLSSAITGTRQFVGLSPYLTDPAAPAIVKFGEFLTTLSQTLDSVYQKLIADDAANFGSQIDTYKNTLRDINQVYLGGESPK